jgi:hypothetical protein
LAKFSLCCLELQARLQRKDGIADTHAVPANCLFGDAMTALIIRGGANGTPAMAPKTTTGPAG